MSTIELGSEKIDVYNVKIFRYSWLDRFIYSVQIYQNERKVAEYKSIEAKDKAELMKILKDRLSRERRFLDKLSFDEKDVKQIYSGREGCMCGCRGNYYEHEKQIKKLYKTMKQFEGGGVEYYPSHEGKIYTVRKPNVDRQYTAYLKD